MNHPVTATEDSYAVCNAFPSADFATDITTGVLANDYAPDGGLVLLGIVVYGRCKPVSCALRPWGGGSASVFSDGRFLCDQPFSSDDQGLIRYNGVDSLTYRVRDADGSTGDATVTLNVGTTGGPVEATIGDGRDDIVLYVSENAYCGDAQCAVSVDGQQIGGVQTATAAHGAEQSQRLNVRGAFGATPHSVTIDLLNDAYNDTAATDRNLNVDHATLNGATIGRQHSGVVRRRPTKLPLWWPGRADHHRRRQRRA